MPTTIRAAVPGDVPLILEFIRALAVFEREPDAVTATEADLLRDGFGPEPYYHCLIADYDGEPAGFAFYFFNYSTWTGNPGLYLEDLYVKPHARGKGFGKALLAELARIAVARGYGRVEWAVLDWNAPSIGFYQKLGAVPMDEWTTYRLTGSELRRLADPNASTSIPSPTRAD